MKYIKVLFAVVIGLFIGSIKRGQQKAMTDPAYTDADDSSVDSPADITPTGWKVVLKRTKEALKDKNLSMAAAGLAYYTTLTFFPAMLGLATIYASAAGPQALLGVIADLQTLVPPAIYDLLQTQLSPLAKAGDTSLGIAALASVAAVLWTTSGGLQNLIKATNVAYDVKESRGFIKLRLLSIMLSAGLLLCGGLILGLLLLQADGLRQGGFPGIVVDVFPILRWPILIMLVTILLAVIYRYAPDRKDPRWSWVSWGAAAATIIWLAGTALFFYYAQHFGNFNKTYGIFAGIIVLMTWFNLTSLIILVGAQVNKKLEEVTEAYR